MLAIIMTALGACALILFILLRIKKRGFAALITKITVSLFFLLTAITATFSHNLGIYQSLFLAVLFGQIFGLVGDILLDLRDLHPDYREPYTFAGFVSFLLGHLMFIGGLMWCYSFQLVHVLVMLGAAAVLCAGVVLTEKPMKLKFGKFKGITAGYSAVFGVSVAAAWMAYAATGRTQTLVMAIGLTAFLLSDLVLSGTYFGEGKNRPVDIALNYILYYGGQFTIALSLLAINEIGGG
ncbi:MAG: lysoplasmalogenase [Oscillospiraceae bacterium]|jgi:hypothetical protein|nr:lysoplasmalogenase [Oscillospiraceae bacterium]